MPYVAVASAQADVDGAIAALTPWVEEAERTGVVLLIKTAGTFADTGKLRMSSTTLPATIWPPAGACLTPGLSPGRRRKRPSPTWEPMSAMSASATVRRRRGAPYISHELMGEGKLPMQDVMNALRSVNYDGFVSLHWEPEWVTGLEDLEMILTTTPCIWAGFGNPRRQKKHLYSNKAGTGKSSGRRRR